MPRSYEQNKLIRDELQQDLNAVYKSREEILGKQISVFIFSSTQLLRSFKSKAIYKNYPGNAEL